MRLTRKQLLNLINKNLNESTRQDPKPPEEPGSSLPIASYLVYPNLTKVSKEQKNYLEKAKGFVFDSKEYLIATGFNLFWISYYVDENTFRPGTVEYTEYKQKSYRGLEWIFRTHDVDVFHNMEYDDEYSETMKPKYSVEEAYRRIENMMSKMHAHLNKHFKILSDPSITKHMGDGKSMNYSDERYQLLLPHDLDYHFNPSQADKIQADLRGSMNSTFDKDFKDDYKRMYLGCESIEQAPFPEAPSNYSEIAEAIKPDELNKYFKVREGNFPKLVIDQKIKELL